MKTYCSDCNKQLPESCSHLKCVECRKKKKCVVCKRTTVAADRSRCSKCNRRAEDNGVIEGAGHRWIDTNARAE